MWLAETSQQPISQTTWLKVTPHCNHCNQLLTFLSLSPHSWLAEEPHFLTHPTVGHSWLAAEQGAPTVGLLRSLQSPHFLTHPGRCLFRSGGGGVGGGGGGGGGGQALCIGGGGLWRHVRGGALQY